QARVLQAAVTVLRQVVGDGSANASLRKELATCLGGLGQMNYDIGRMQAAERLLQEALGIVEKLVQERPGVVRHEGLLGMTWQRLGEVKLALGQTALAQAAFQRALDMELDLDRRDPGNAGRLIGL